MIEKINEITKAIKNECYLPALALTLTLPDICAKVKYNTTGRSAYIKWYDEYVKPLYFIKDEDSSKFLQFDGKLCYALRCSLLHEGNFELRDKKSKLIVDKFKLHINKIYGNFNINNSYYEEDGYNVIDLDIYGLCYYICYAVKEFYYNYADKEIFKKYDSIIIDESLSDEIYDSIF